MLSVILFVYLWLWCYLSPSFPGQNVIVMLDQIEIMLFMNSFLEIPKLLDDLKT